MLQVKASQSQRIKKQRRREVPMLSIYPVVTGVLDIPKGIESKRQSIYV